MINITVRSLRFFSVFIFFILIANGLMSQKIHRIDPPNWWVGMENPELQLLIHGDNIAKYEVSLSQNEFLENVVRTDNPNYLFLNLNIPKNTMANTFSIILKENGEVVNQIGYVLEDRIKRDKAYQGFTTKDVMYLLMPDRFSNGDLSNDNIDGMREAHDRNFPDGRHGGDIQGIINHLDYINSLGVTTLWINPLMENDMPKYSYHGYAITDHYKIDARFGTNEDYVRLADETHKKGLKLVMDVVLNHCGSSIWWMDDLPSEDWIYQFPKFTRTNYSAPSIIDPYASSADKELMLTGWFDTSMPDLNQTNPLHANYLIQNSIWWIEYAGLDGIRLDTQPYSSKEMVADWAARIRAEYPDFTIVGESWLQKIVLTSYWQERADNPDGYNSNIQVVTDFPLTFALRDALSEKKSWNDGLMLLYDVLTQDNVYNNPQNTLVFGDNHDLTRLLTHYEGNVDKLKMAMAFLLTTRGIPNIYSGTEILLEGNEHDGHGKMRKDFPGGWPDDAKNAFVAEGRSTAQNNMINYMSTILNWRKNKTLIHEGKLTHFIPQDDIYVYFRHDEDESVMIILNNNNEEKILNTERFYSFLSNVKTGYDITSKKEISELSEIILKAKSARIIELKK